MRIALIATIIFICSCGTNSNESSVQSIKPVVVMAQGKCFAPDSLPKPPTIPLDEGSLQKTPMGQPQVASAHSNVHPAGSACAHRQAGTFGMLRLMKGHALLKRLERAATQNDRQGAELICNELSPYMKSLLEQLG